jgi:hypothetical protein
MEHTTSFRTDSATYYRLHFSVLNQMRFSELMIDSTDGELPTDGVAIPRIRTRKQASFNNAPFIRGIALPSVGPALVPADARAGFHPGLFESL